MTLTDMWAPTLPYRARIAGEIGESFAEHYGNTLPDTRHPASRYDEHHAERVARWYWAHALDQTAPDYRAVTLWRQLAEVVDAQYDALMRSGFRHTVVETDPYDAVEQVWRDADAGHLYTFASVPGEHPLWTAEQNDRFRFVHDMLTHYAHRLRFDREGEDMAYRVHRATMPRHLWSALATETRAQNAALNFATVVAGRDEPTFAPQVAVVSPGWLYVP